MHADNMQVQFREGITGTNYPGLCMDNIFPQSWKLPLLEGHILVHAISHGPWASWVFKFLYCFKQRFGNIESSCQQIIWLWYVTEIFLSNSMNACGTTGQAQIWTNNPISIHSMFAFIGIIIFTYMNKWTHPYIFRTAGRLEGQWSRRKKKQCRANSEFSVIY